MTAKRVLAATILAVIAALLPHVPAQAADLMAPDVRQIVERGRLVVAMYHRDTPPFYFRTAEGHMDGFDVKLIQGFAKRLGVAVEFNRDAQSFDEVVDRVARGEADLAISKLSRTFTRSMRVRYSRPYVVLRQGLLVNRLELARQAGGEPTEKAIRNLRGKIGVIKGSSYEDFAKQRFPAATVVGYPTWEGTIEAAARGEVVAAFRDELEVKKLIRSAPDTLINFQTVVLSDTRDPIAIAVNWRAPNLLALVETYLEDQDIHVNADAVLDEYMPIRRSRR